MSLPMRPKLMYEKPISSHAHVGGDPAASPTKSLETWSPSPSSSLNCGRDVGEAYHLAVGRPSAACLPHTRRSLRVALAQLLERPERICGSTSNT